MSDSHIKPAPPPPPPDPTDAGSLSAGDAAFEAHLLTASGSCPPPKLLFAAQEGVLPAEANEQILQHISTCSLCQMLLEDSAAVAGEPSLTPAQDAHIRERIASRINSEAHRPSAFAKRSWAPQLAIAAILCIAAAIALFYHGHQDTISTPIATNPATTPTPKAALPPTLLAEVTNPQPLPPPSGSSADLVLRGPSTSSPDDPSAADLLPAFRAYNRQDYATAAKQFDALSSRFPKAVTPALYLGVAQLEAGQNTTAANTLQHALDLASPARPTEAVWYLAIAKARLGDTQASQLFREVCAASMKPGAAPSTFGAKSCTVTP